VRRCRSRDLPRAGLGLNTLLGWWWADPAAGFVIVFYGLKEGWGALHHGNGNG
jgi:divalent metal cation (Fe/Co/Zn/Cd) transporter